MSLSLYIAVRSLKELLPSSKKSPLLGLPTRQSKGKSLCKPRRVVSVGRKSKERNTLPLLHSIEQYFKHNNDSTKERTLVSYCNIIIISYT